MDHTSIIYPPRPASSTAVLPFAVLLSFLITLPLYLQQTLIPIKNIYMEMRKETQPYPQQTHKLKYVESDFKSAIAKLTEGALQYDRSRVTADQLAAFHSATMPPYMFKVLHSSSCK